MLNLMTNPDPARITEPMWRLWTHRPNKAWRFAGIYANKKGYHNSVNNNKKYWPDSYSIKLPLDLVPINQNVARAIDLTMSDAEMKRWTLNMKNSALDPDDPRLDSVKEFFGTLDGKSVFGLTKNSEKGEWREASADDSHLWHGHMGLFAFFVNDEDRINMILSVWAGESLEEWKRRTMTVSLPKLGDSGESVKYWQYVHNLVRKSTTPPALSVTVDGDYGPSTAKAFADFVHKQGGQPGFNGNSIPSWLAIRYEVALILASAPAPSTSPAISEEKLKELVDAWLAEHIPSNLTVTADLKGKITI